MEQSVLKKWGEISDIEQELVELTDERAFNSRVAKKKKELRKLIQGLDKSTLRGFRYQLSEEILELEDALEFTNVKKTAYLEQLAEVEFFFCECRSIVAEEIDRSIMEQRERLSNEDVVFA